MGKLVKNDILTVEQKQTAIIVSKTKISVIMTPRQQSQRQDGSRRQRCGLRNEFKKKNKYCQILVKYALKVITGEASKSYKKKKNRHRTIRNYV